MTGSMCGQKLFAGNWVTPSQCRAALSAFPIASPRQGAGINTFVLSYLISPTRALGMERSSGGRGPCLSSHSVRLPSTPHSPVPSPKARRLCPHSMKDGKQRVKSDSVVPSGRGTYAKQACSHCRKRCVQPSSFPTTTLPDIFHSAMMLQGRVNATGVRLYVARARRQVELQRYVITTISLAYCALSLYFLSAQSWLET